jgi:hypothetical protein
MSRSIRALALLTPLLALHAADEAPAPAPKPKPDDTHLNNLDLRVVLGGGGGLTRVRNEDTDVEVDHEDGSGGTLAVHLLYLRARPGGVGFSIGGGLFTHAYDGEPENSGGPTTTVSVAGIDVTAAFVYRPTRNWHFELPAVVLSGGSAEVETDGVSGTDDGSYGRFALQVGAYYTFDIGLQLGLNLGGAGFAAVVEREVAPGVEQEISYSGGGGYLNLVLGFRF